MLPKVLVDVRDGTDAEKLFVAEVLRKLEDPTEFTWPDDDLIWWDASYIGFWYNNSKCVYVGSPYDGDRSATLLTLDEFKDAFNKKEEE